MGDTGWYLPARLNRDEAEYYLEQCRQKGYNVVQVMVMNTMPAINTYGKWALPHGFDFTNIDEEGEYGYGITWITSLRLPRKKEYIIGRSVFGEAPYSRKNEMRKKPVSTVNFLPNGIG